MLKWTLLFCFALLPIAAWAQTDRFDAAIEDWLQGDDETSLPALADLAGEGHSLARILLSQIEVKDRGPSPFRAALKPAEARALFRRDAGYGGFSQTWLSVASKAGDPLAQTLIATRLPRPVPGLIANLRRMGEVQATGDPIRAVALYGTASEKKVLAESDAMLDELRPYLIHHSGTQRERGEGIEALRHIAPFAAEMIDDDDTATREMGALLELGFGSDNVDLNNPWRGLVEDWVLTAPATRPLADLCRDRCAKDVTGCGFALLALSGGYYEVIRLDTPLESVITQERFLASPRARLMSLRRAALAKQPDRRGWLASYDALAEISTCTADLIAETRADYE